MGINGCQGTHILILRYAQNVKVHIGTVPNLDDQKSKKEDSNEKNKNNRKPAFYYFFFKIGRPVLLLVLTVNPGGKSMALPLVLFFFEKYLRFGFFLFWNSVYPSFVYAIGN